MKTEINQIPSVIVYDIHVILHKMRERERERERERLRHGTSRRKHAIMCAILAVVFISAKKFCTRSGHYGA